MKQTSSALTFLLAQYRAIFKRAYIKGIASAVILTAGLAAGQAQATPSDDDPFYTTTDNSKWTETTQYRQSAISSSKRVAGDYDDGTTADHDDGIVSDETLVIGASGGTINGDISGISGDVPVYGGYVLLKDTTSADSATAHNNRLEVKSGGTLNTTGNIVGGWAKTLGDGFVTATENKLTIDKDAKLNEAGQFIGGVAAGQNGALAQDNRVELTGDTATKKPTVNNTGNYGAIVFIGQNGTASGSTGVFEALDNTVDMSGFTASGSLAKNMTFVGGHVSVEALATDHQITRLSSTGNTVDLSDFTIGGASQTVLGHIVANKVALNAVNGTVANIEANGTAGTGVTLTDGTLYASQVYGGWAQNHSGGNATANANNVSIIDTDLKVLDNGSGSVVYGGYAQTVIATDSITSKSQTVTLTASHNTVTIKNTDTSEKAEDKDAVGDVYGALLDISGSSVTNALGSTMTADSNTVTIGEGVKVSSGSIAGAYIKTNNTSLTSGGATVKASNNKVTLEGDFTADTGAVRTISAVTTESGLTTAENNSVVINGKITGANNAQIVAVNVSEQKVITGSSLEKKEDIVHHLSNNSVTIGAKAEVSNVSIAAVTSYSNSAYTLNNDVTIAGKVSNSDILGGTGADSVIDAQAGSQLTYSSTSAANRILSSDVINLAGTVSVGQHDTLKVRGYANNGQHDINGYNTNLTTIKSTAAIYNSGTVELYGDTTVEAGAKLHALKQGATIKVDGDKDGGTIKTGAADNALNVDLVGGRGQLTISKAQLQSYLTAGEKYTLEDKTTSEDFAGNVSITSNGVLEFSDDAVDLSTLDYVTSTDAKGAVGKVIVDGSAGTSILKGDAVTVSHALVSDYAAASKLDFSKDADYNKFLTDLTLDNASGVSIEANDLFLGSSRITGEQAADIKFAKATAKDSINFTVGEGTFQLSSTVAGNNYMRTNDLESDLDFFTALDGKVNGDVDVVSGGKLSIEYGHWTANGDIKLVADTATASTLEVGIDNNTNTDERNHIDLNDSDAKLPDATLVLDQALTVDLSHASGKAQISVSGDAAGGYSYTTDNGTERNRLGVYDEEFAQNTVGDDHYVMLDLRNGLKVVGDTNAQGQLNGKLTLTAENGGVVKMMADDLNAILTQNDTVAAANAANSGSFIKVSNYAHLQVTGDVSADFGDFGANATANGIELGANGVMSANSLSLIHNHDSGAATDDTAYIATNKIYFGSETGTVAVNEVFINDQQRVEKDDNSGSDNSYASKVTLAQGTLDIAENLSSLNDTLALGDTATKAHLNFYGADIDPSVSGATTGTINVDTIEVVNGSVDVENGAWEGNNFILGASGDMTVGGDEDELANLKAKSVTMAAGSLLDVYATGSMSVDSVDFSALAAATRDSVNGDTGVHVAGTLIINGDASAEKGGVKFGADSSIAIAKNGVLKFGSAATTGAILANNSYSGADSIKLIEGYHQIANNGGELHLAFADNTVFDANAIKELKRDLFTSGSFEDYAHSTQLASGGILNIGDASFTGVETSDFESLTAPGTSGYTIAWNDVRDFSDIYGNDVTNNKLSNVNVNSIREGGADKIQGIWGSLSMEDGVGASAQVTIAGNTSLRNAAGNNGLFISDAAHQQAMGAIVESQKDLKLIGGGQIGKITLDAGNEDAEKNWTVLEVSDGATTIAAIDAKNTAQIADATVVNLYSDTTVTGDINNIDVVEAYQGAQVKAANAKVTEISTQNADIDITGDLTFQEAFVFGGSLSAKNADMDALGGNEMAVINGGRFDAETFKGTDGATIRVGLDTSSLPANVSLEDITLDDGTVAGGTGYFEVDTLELNHATLVVDPEYTEATSVAAALKFKKGNEQYAHNDVGTLVGEIHVGKNAVFGIGASVADTQTAISDYMVGNALDQEKYGSILYLNGQLTVDNRSEIALNAHDADIRQSLLYTITGNELNQFADLGLGKNTAIIMTENAFALTAKTQ